MSLLRQVPACRTSCRRSPGSTSRRASSSKGSSPACHESPYKGFSVEFSDHRKYIPGDELRQIDWKVYGRTDRYYVKRFQAETNMECHLLLDKSASMDYEPETVPARFMNKFEYSMALAAALGYLMILQQDAVGLITFDTEVRDYAKPSSKRAPSRQHALAPRQHPPVEADRASPNRSTRRRGCSRSAASSSCSRTSSTSRKRSTRRSRTFSYRGHDVIVFHILDAAEAANFPFDGPTWFTEPETGARLTGGRRLRAGGLPRGDRRRSWPTCAGGAVLAAWITCSWTRRWRSTRP